MPFFMHEAAIWHQGGWIICLFEPAPPAAWIMVQDAGHPESAWLRRMGKLYEFLGLSFAVVQQGFSPARCRRAFAADVTYLTANALGFSFLVDSSSINRPEHLVRPGLATPAAPRAAASRGLHIDTQIIVWSCIRACSSRRWPGACQHGAGLAVSVLGTLMPCRAPSVAIEQRG